MPLKRNDLILIAVILAIAAIGFVVYLFVKPSDPGAFVQVNHAGDIVASYPLNKDITVPLEFDGHTNILQIENGQALMIEADCHDQICVKHKPIDLSGEQIVCLPNKIVLEVFASDQEKGEFDVDW